MRDFYCYRLHLRLLKILFILLLLPLELRRNPLDFSCVWLRLWLQAWFLARLCARHSARLCAISSGEQLLWNNLLLAGTSLPGCLGLHARGVRVHRVTGGGLRSLVGRSNLHLLRICGLALAGGSVLLESIGDFVLQFRVARLREFLLGGSAHCF